MPAADAGVRGALPLPPPAAPPAAGAARLRDLAGDPPERRRLLPRPAAGRHPEPRAPAPVPRVAARRLVAPAGGEAPRAAAAARAIRALVPDPDRAHLVPYNTTRARARSRDARSASRCTAPTRASSPRDEDAAAAASSPEEGVRHPLGREDLSTTDDLVGGGRASCARERPAWRRCREAERGRLGRGQRAPRPRRARRPARRADGDRRPAADADAVRVAGDRLRRYMEKLDEAGRRRRGAHRRRGVPQPERPAAHHAARRASRCSPRTTSCSAGRAARPTSAASSRRTRATPTAITREAAKVGRRLAAEGVIGRFALDFVVVRERGRRLGAVRDRDQPAQGRHDAPVPHAPVPHGRRVRRRDRALHRAERQAEVLRRLATTSRAPLPRADARGPLRHRRAHRPPLRPVAADRRRLPHDERARRVRPHRADGRGGEPGEAYALYEQAAATLDQEAQAALAERRLPG